MARGDRAKVLSRGLVRGLSIACACAAVWGCAPRARDGERAADAGGAVGSQSQQASEVKGADAARARIEARAALAPLVDGHNARVASLESFEAPASTVLRYPNGDRVQEDQLDGLIYLASGGRGAMELRLLGSTYAWLGGDGTKSWIYLALPDQPRRMHVYDRLVDGADMDAAKVVDSAELTLLTPASLRFLLGLVQIPDGWTVEPIAGVDAARADLAPRERFEVQWSPRASLRASARFGKDGNPERMAVTDSNGNAIAISVLSEYSRVLRENLSSLSWPLTATRVLIDAPRSNSSARLTLDQGALRQPARRVRSEFFDLAEMQMYLSPTEVVYHDPAGTVRGGPAPQRGPAAAPNAPNPTRDSKAK